MANFCSNCGKPLRAGVKFCGNCGKKISSATEETPQQNLNSSNNYEDMLTAGAGLLAGTGVAIATETAYAQQTNVPPADVNGFYGFTSNGLQEMTGSVDVTNIVAHVAHSFGVENVAEYIDVVADGADELLDAAADAIGDVAGEVAGEAAGSLVDALFEFI